MNAERDVSSQFWDHAGFSPDDAAAWWAAGWADPAEAARWRRACPHASPESLRRLRDGGYSPDQPARVARLVDDNVVAWTRALVGDAPGDPESHRAREATALYALELVSSTPTLSRRWERHDARPNEREREPQRA